MLSLSCQAVLFDLDGTLVDSTPFIERLWQNWGMQHDIPPQRMADVMHGRRAGEIISIVTPHLSIKETQYALETDEISMMVGMKTHAGAKELLSALSTKQWAIVTSGSLRVASARLDYARLPIPEILVTGDDVKDGKPAPDAYLLAAKRLHMEPEDCIVVEDAPAGIQAGKAAGMKVIGIASSHSKAELNQADFVIQQLADIHLYIAGNQINIRLK